MNLSCLDGVGPGIDIIDAKGLHLVKMGPIRIPVIRVSLRDGSDPRFPNLQHKAGRTNAFFKLLTFGTGFKHGQMIIGHNEWKVGNTCVKFENHAMFTIRLDALDRFEVRFGSGLGFFPPMVVHGVDHILRIQ